MLILYTLVTKTALDSIIKLLLIVEHDRVEQKRKLIVKRMKQGKLDKISGKLRDDIKEFLSDRSIKQIYLMNKHNISRNTLKNIYQ
ncbi:hypothetical protein [Sarcina ventriculi]|uniref:hypothetical protein n=1 Tax=Sarcina ventriculi TaxID=1267 RepID=UPI001C10E69F|nr:hypothetical protein [Sarcina ventriculi]MBU5323592.1 hypothetical protein [Sarcina ventriculi]